MKYDYSTVDDEMDDYVSVPNGTYLCRIAEVREKNQDDNVQRWSIRWEVREGPYAGRTAAWDNLSWTDKGVKRVKMILKQLGFPVDGELDLSKDDLIHRQALVTVYTQEYEDPNTGRRVTRSRVPFAGYQAVDSPNEDAKEATPF